MCLRCVVCQSKYGLIRIYFLTSSVSSANNMPYLLLLLIIKNCYHWPVRELVKMLIYPVLAISNDRTSSISSAKVRPCHFNFCLLLLISSSRLSPMLWSTPENVLISFPHLICDSLSAFFLSLIFFYPPHYHALSAYLLPKPVSLPPIPLSSVTFPLTLCLTFSSSLCCHSP